MDVGLEFEILKVLLGHGHLLIDALHPISVLRVEEVAIVLALLKELY